MSTRSLVMVVVDKQVKIAQYGDSDGYPSVEGVNVLGFLNKIQGRKAEIVDKIRKIEFYTAKELDKAATQNHPELNLSASEILHYLLDHDVKKVVNSSDFANDSLFCQWCYVIDFDKSTFEVYKGLNKKPLYSIDRFYNKGTHKSAYYPVKIVKSFNLNNLPSDAEFTDIVHE